MTRGTTFRLLLACLLACAPAYGHASRHRPSPPAQGGAISFSRSSVTLLDNSSGHTEVLGLRNYDGGNLKAIQWTVVNTNGKLRFSSASLGATLALNPNWVFTCSIHHGALLPDLGSNDTLNVLLLGTNNETLAPGNYDSLVLLHYECADIRGTFEDSTTLHIRDVVGSLSDASDAQLSAGPDLTVRIQNTVQKADVDGNDAVDISDLVAMIDHIVGRHSIYGDALQRADIAPWPTGDSSVNVRDLVLTQNVIVSGAYPDGTPLNAMPRRQLESLLNPPAAEATPDVVMTIFVSNHGVVVKMESAVQVKGVQLELNNVLAVPDTLQVNSSFGSGSWGLSSNVFRVLMYNDSGLPLDPGSRYLSWLMFGIPKPLGVNLKKIVVADINNNAITNIQVSIVYGEPSPVYAAPFPTSLVLEQNAPNPFSNGTTIAFTLEQAETVTLVVHSLDGAAVRTLLAGRHEAGRHLINWDGRDEAARRLSPGMYLCTLTSMRQQVTRRMLLIP